MGQAVIYVFSYTQILICVVTMAYVIKDTVIKCVKTGKKIKNADGATFKEKMKVFIKEAKEQKAQMDELNKGKEVQSVNNTKIESNRTEGEFDSMNKTNSSQSVFLGPDDIGMIKDSYNDTIPRKTFTNPDQFIS